MHRICNWFPAIAHMAHSTTAFRRSVCSSREALARLAPTHEHRPRRPSSCRHPCHQILEPVEDYLDLIILAADVPRASRSDPPDEPAIWCDVVRRSQHRSSHEEQFPHRHRPPEMATTSTSRLSTTRSSSTSSTT